MITYTYYDLENKTHYYIQSEGVTKKGIPVQTSLVHVFVDFEQQETTKSAEACLFAGFCAELYSKIQK